MSAMDKRAFHSEMESLKQNKLRLPFQKPTDIMTSLRKAEKSR